MQLRPPGAARPARWPGRRPAPPPTPEWQETREFAEALTKSLAAIAAEDRREAMVGLATIAAEEPVIETDPVEPSPKPAEDEVQPSEPARDEALPAGQDPPGGERRRRSKKKEPERERSIEGELGFAVSRKRDGSRPSPAPPAEELSGEKCLRCHSCGGPSQWGMCETCSEAFGELRQLIVSLGTD